VGTGLAIKAAAAVTAGLAIGGAGYEGVRHTPWHSQKPAAAAPARPVVAGGASIAPRGPSGVAVAPTRGGRGNAAKAPHAKPKKANKLKTHGRANQTHPASSVATRHATVVHAPQRAHPARGAATHKKAKPNPPKAKPLHLPGPVVERPPPGHGKQK
jgi:hypothetical protein